MAVAMLSPEPEQGKRRDLAENGRFQMYLDNASSRSG